MRRAQGRESAMQNVIDWSIFAIGALALAIAIGATLLTVAEAKAEPEAAARTQSY